MIGDVRAIGRALILVMATVAALATPLGRAAPAALAQDSTSRLLLAHFTPVIGPGTAAEPGQAVRSLTLRVLLSHDDPTSLSDVDLVVETFGRLTSRSLLHQALDGGLRTARVIERVPLVVDELGPGEVAGAEVIIAADRVAVRGQGGVYPVQISAVKGTTVIDQIITAAIHLDEVPANPLRTVMVWPITTAPSHRLDGTFDPVTLADLQPGGRLGAMLAALEASGARGMVAEVAPHLLEGLQATVAATPGDAAPTSDDERDASRAAAVLERLRAMVATAPLPPITGPLGDADLSGLMTDPDALAELAGGLAAGGRDGLERLTGRAPEATTFLATARLTAAALDLLPGQHLLVPYDHLDEPDPHLEPDLPWPTRTIRGASGRELVVTVADPHVAQRLDTPELSHGSVAAVQQVLVETAMIFFESPGIPDRPLLILPPQDWDPGEGLARALTTQLPASSWLRLVGAGELAGEPALPRAQVATGAPATQPEVVADIAATLGRLSTARTALVDGNATIGGQTTTGLLDAVGRASSVALADRPQAARDLLAEVDARVEAAYGTIEVPSESGITLTAEEVPIPVTVRRIGGEPLEVEIELVSGGSLDFPGGSVQRLVLGPDSVQTVSFLARSRSRGTLPVTVIVRTAAGEREFARASLTVNSQVVSRPALIAVAAVVVLLLMLGRRRRRPPQPPDPGGLAVVTGGPGSNARPDPDDRDG